MMIQGIESGEPLHVDPFAVADVIPGATATGTDVWVWSAPAAGGVTAAGVTADRSAAGVASSVSDTAKQIVNHVTDGLSSLPGWVWVVVLGVLGWKLFGHLKGGVHGGTKGKTRKKGGGTVRD
jgi:hypothetical protein